jgi:hypothetical protein
MTKSKRDYKAEYAKYQGTEEQKKKRARAQQAARRKGDARRQSVSKGDGNDVAHKLRLWTRAARTLMVLE